MKKLILILCSSALISLNAFAENCDSKKAEIVKSLYTKYKINQKRAIANQVIVALTTSEREELFGLSKLFNSIPHDTPEHQNDRFAWQKRAKEIIRVVTRRAGFKIINPETGDPFDAVIGQVVSSDHYVEYIIEVCEMLVLNPPLPHITLWLYRMDPAHNPFKIVYLRIKAEPKDDIVMWSSPDFSQKLIGSIDQFATSQLPAECHTND